MPPMTRSQAAAAAARRRDLEARRGVLTRREVRTAAALWENVEAAASVRSKKNSRAGAVVARPQAELKKPARGNSKPGSGRSNGAALVRNVQIRVEAEKEAEISRATSSKRARYAVAAPASRGCAAGERHICSLCEDLVLQIFLRLPSLATVVRAACACAAWRRAVASSPDFRRRFLGLHPSPLLGLFITKGSIVAGSPGFVPARPLCRDLAAALRGGDFLLTSFLDSGDWRVISSSSCRLGNLLVHNREDKLLAAFNPWTRQPSEDRRVLDLLSRNMVRGHFFCAMVSSEKDPVSSPMMLLDHAASKMKASIYSMDTGVCSAAAPWVDVPACPHQDNDHRVVYGMAAQLNDGSVHYLVENWGYTVSIDTITLGFTVIELPQCVNRKSFSIGETDDGATCLVYSDGLDVGVLMHTRDVDNGAQKWMLDRVVSMDAELRRVLPAGQFDDGRVCVLRVFAVRDGYVFLSTSATLQADRYWYLSLCLGTMKLDKLFQGTYGCNGIPYIMPWPRSLFGN